jgi:hypothetical protein
VIGGELIDGDFAIMAPRRGQPASIVAGLPILSLPPVLLARAESSRPCPLLGVSGNATARNLGYPAPRVDRGGDAWFQQLEARSEAKRVERLEQIITALLEMSPALIVDRNDHGVWKSLSGFDGIVGVCRNRWESLESKENKSQHVRHESPARFEHSSSIIYILLAVSL